tara:strand:- start:583 stop:759 length:177 start_codon:yes stop_codon:yes gene_type:complete
MNAEMREEMKILNELLNEKLQRKELRTLQGRPKEESTSREALDRVYNRGIDNQVPTNG